MLALKIQLNLPRLSNVSVKQFYEFQLLLPEHL